MFDKFIINFNNINCFFKLLMNSLKFKIKSILQTSFLIIITIY